MVKFFSNEHFKVALVAKMDTQVGSCNAAHGEDTKVEAGASYAHAVQNFKTTLPAVPAPPAQPAASITNTTTTTTTPLEKLPTKQTELDAGDDGGSFTTVINHSRKERKNEKKKTKHSLVNGVVDKHERHHDKSHEKNGGSKLKYEKDETKLQEESDSKRVFVAAPLPKVNPWKNVPKSPVEAVESVPQPVVEQQPVPPPPKPVPTCPTNTQPTVKPAEKKKQSQNSNQKVT